MPNIMSRLSSCIHRHEIKKKKKVLNCFEKIQYVKLSRFELMCDEILLEMFEYLSIIDLYNGFVNLNYRLNYLINNLSIGIDLDQLNNFNPSLINYFSKQIFYLKLSYNPSINLNQFSNLRSLIVYNPTKDQLLTITKDIFPKLNRLFLGFIKKKDQSIVWKNLFGNKQFNQLKSCYLFNIDFNQNLSIYSKSSTINILFLKSIPIKSLLNLLHFFPYLYKLDVSLTENSFLQNSYSNQNLIHKNLKDLKMEFFDKTFQLNQLEFLLKHFPSVEKFDLILLNLIEMKDLILLEEMIKEYLINLNKFLCSIDYFCSLSTNHLINKFQMINSLFENIQLIHCQLHQNNCLRKIFINNLTIK